MGRLELKLLAVLVLLVGLPLAVALWQASTLFERSLDAAINPKVGQALDDAVRIYGDFIKAEKARQRAVAERLAESPELARRLAESPEAAAGWLRTHAAAPRVFSIVLRPENEAPLVRAEPPAPLDGDWLRRTESVPLALPGYRALEFTFGLERAFIERFEQMEAEVIRPFNALAADRDNVADVYAWSFVGYLTAAVLLAALISVIVARRITRRLARLRGAMETVAAGELGVEVPLEGLDEIAELSRGFNDMARRLQDSQARVRYLTQVSAWQGIARRLAHEIKNPLTPIQLAVQQISETDRSDDARFARTLATAREIVEQEVRTLERLVDNFSRFARLPQVDPTPIELDALVRDLVRAHPEIDTFIAELPEGPVRALADRDLLRQALTNLAKNGAEAARDAGRAAHVVIAVHPDAEGPRITVDDNGPGVPADRRQHIFEPYVTGKEDGTGLGLAIVKKIVLDHGGRIAVTDGRLGGARFEIQLPAPDPAG